MAGEHSHVLVQQPVVVHRSHVSRSRALGASSSRRREFLEGGQENSDRSSHQAHSFSISRSSEALSRTNSTSSDNDFLPPRTSPSSSSSSSSSSGSSSTGIRSARTSLRLAFHGRRGSERRERGAVVGDHSALGRATRRGGSDNHGRRSSLFLSLVDPEGSLRSASTGNCLVVPESSSGDMLPGVEVARRRRVRIADTYEGGHGGGQESGHSSRSSRSGVTVAHHHHHYHHHHHHHVHHQTSRNPSRPGTPRPGSLVRRMHDFLHDHRSGRSPFEQFSNSNSTERASAVDSSVNPHTAYRRGHGHRSSEGESRIAPLSSLWRRQSSDTSSNLRGAALEARNRLDERLRAAAHASHSRRSWQAVQSSYDMNLLFSDDEEDNLWSDDDGWETSLHEWLAAWAPSAVEERWSRVESSSSGRASSSRNPAFRPRPSEGLSKATISALPRQVVGTSKTQAGGNRSKMEQEDCPVCLEGFVTGQSLMSLPCNHRFHPECLTPWLANHGQCPYCRADIVKDTDSNSEQKSNNGLMSSSNEELLSWVEAIERGMDRLSYS